MTTTAFLFVLLSVLFNSSWHFISKSSKPRILYYLTVSTAVIVWFSLSLFWSYPLLPHLSAPLLIALLFGGFFGWIGDIGFSMAYLNADLSVAYPLLSSLPLLLLSIITSVFHLGKPLTPQAMIGIVLIVIGATLLPLQKLSDFSLKNYWNRGMIGIFMAVLATIGYTIADSAGSKMMQALAKDYQVNSIAASATYTMLRECVICSSLFLTVNLIRSERENLHPRIYKNGLAWVAAAGAGGAYICILLALSHASNMSYVKTFELLSLPLTAIMGIIFLKEKASFLKITALILLCSGLAISALYCTR